MIDTNLARQRVAFLYGLALGGRSDVHKQADEAVDDVVAALDWLDALLAASVVPVVPPAPIAPPVVAEPAPVPAPPPVRPRGADPFANNARRASAWLAALPLSRASGAGWLTVRRIAEVSVVSLSAASHGLAMLASKGLAVRGGSPKSPVWKLTAAGHDMVATCERPPRVVSRLDRIANGTQRPKLVLAGDQ